MPSVLGRHIQDDLGISAELVFAGITVMFAVGAVCSPRIGKVDRPHRRAQPDGGRLGDLCAGAGRRLAAARAR